MTTRKRHNQNQPAKTRPSSRSKEEKIRAVRDLVYTGKRWSEDEDTYVLYSTPQQGYFANKWYWGTESSENCNFIVPTELPLTAISLLQATSVATSIAQSHLASPIINVSLPRSDVVFIDDKKYLWCDMSKIVVVVLYRDPLVVVPRIGHGIWGTTKAVLVDEQEEFWEGGKWEECYWFMQEWGENQKPEKKTETVNGTLEIVKLKHSEMSITNDAYDWYLALLGIQNVFFPLLALSPFALYKTDDRRYVITLTVPNQKRFARVIVPLSYCTPRKQKI